MAQIDWGRLALSSLPLLILTGGGMVILLVSAFRRRGGGTFCFLFSLLLVLAAFFLSWREWWEGMPNPQGMLFFDRLSYLMDLLILIPLLLSLFFSYEYLREKGIDRGEYYALLLFASAGLMLIAHAEDLLVLFLGIEIAALATYVLAGFQRGSIRSYESALKYFVLGSFASAFFLYGVALAYGAVGSTSLSVFSGLGVGGEHESLLLLLSVAFLLIGVAFKIAAVPFHFWAPDVYEGAPTPVTAFMASAVKVGGFAALVRIALALGHLPEIPWETVLWVLAVLTMTIGNLMALRQTNIKRLLAYSSVAHAGYALVGVVAALHDATAAASNLGGVLFYLFAYSLMTIGAFGVVITLGRKRPSEPVEISDYAELAERHPGLAAVLSVFLLSLVGIPPTIGFVGKFYLFSGAMQAGLTGLVVIGVLNSVVSVYYYLAPVVKMYFQKGGRIDPQPISGWQLTGLVLCLFGVLYLGIFPSNLFLLARESVRGLVF